MPTSGTPRRALNGALLGLLAAPGLAAAQPAGNAVTLLVGGAAGSAGDLWARSFVPFLERHWPHSAIGVLNRPGAGGLAAARALAAAAPDGRVAGSVSTPLLAARAVEAGDGVLLGRLEFLAAVAEEPLLLVGHPGSLDDFAGLGRLPGPVLLGTPPQGSAAQLAGVALGLALAPRVPLGLLAFPTAAGAREAVMAGHIPCAMLAAPEAIAALRDDRLVPLGVAQARRSPLLPEVPTLAEQGVPLVLVARRGFAVPAGVPPALLEPLLRAMRAAVADPEFAAQATARGYVPRFLGPTAWAPEVRRLTGELAARWASNPWVTPRD